MGDDGVPPGRAVRRRRRRPEHLRLPRRDDPQHRGVRARLPGRHDRPARAELPLDPDHPVGGQRGHHAQHRAARQAAVDRRRRRRADRRLRRRQRARRGVVRRHGDRPALRRGGRARARRRGVLPDQRAVAVAGGGLHPGRPALQGRRRRALLRAQGDPRRGGLPALPGQPGRRHLAAPHPQHAHAAGSATGPRRCVEALAQRERISFGAALRPAPRRRRRSPPGR